ncbi:pentatricopeptide repeat-containing protein At4g18975, chloroplastic isoform X2 [Euphorbia lathyris]|uniref:pentatricopeptide repeat-containing protein At4g18975, chloroplastic isoform X2 n=1 Tax=Euphorbia lathyris TaxID=212925 RepID=UPI0033141150
MWCSSGMSSLVSRLSRVGAARILASSSGFSGMMHSQTSCENITRSTSFLEKKLDKSQHEGICQKSENAKTAHNYKIGKNVSMKDKINFLLKTLSDLKDSKEAVYGALDAWVAWEHNFPIASLKRVLITLEKEQQWHKVIQVIKWMLSKGQGNTMGTYCQLIRALDMDHRAEEAHTFWSKKIGTDLHSVPWQLCNQMLSIYYRNNMLESLIKLFKGLEAFDRKPPEKSIVQKVADAYEVLGKFEEKERVLQKYNDLFTGAEKGDPKKSRKFPSKRKSGRRKDALGCGANAEGNQ